MALASALDLSHLPAGPVAEYRAKELLAGAGVPVPKGGLAQGPGRGRGHCRAHRLSGRPQGAGRGAGPQERCRRRDPERGRRGRAARRLGARCTTTWQRAKPGLALDGVLVEAMAAKGLELIVGARRDPQWGAVLMLGLGGIWVETLQGRATAARGRRQGRHRRGAGPAQGRGAPAAEPGARRPSTSPPWRTLPGPSAGSCNGRPISPSWRSIRWSPIRKAGCAGARCPDRQERRA